MSRQLRFDLPVRAALGRSDFFVSPANATALALIDTWPDWSAGKLLVLGPKGAGKTHLAHVWADRANAQVVPAEGLERADIPSLASGPIAVEDVHAIAGQAPCEDALFHLHNLVLSNGHTLLMTGTGAPRGWPIALPDLASRLLGTPATTIHPPDEALLGAVLTKLFADRQIAPAPGTIGYLVSRMDRSFDTARQIVSDLDALAMDKRRNINPTLAREVLDKTAPDTS